MRRKGVAGASMDDLGALAAVLPISLVLTGVFTRLAPRLGFLDKPNERSMHTKVTPRAGGIALVVTFLAYVGSLAARGSLAPEIAWTLLAGGAIVALMGFLDDRRPLPNTLRVPVWLAVATASVWALGGLPSLDIGAFPLPLGIAGAILAALALVWMINLYNFMDGIDGIAGAQAVIAGLAGGGMLLMAGHTALASVALALAAASGGFLAWNWAPAKIFMGDVGSGFLGSTFGILAIASERAGAVPLLAWAILFAPFLVDATFTLFWRTLHGLRFYQPHRTHVYQLLVQRGGSHRQVTTLYAATACLLTPIAWLAWRVPLLRIPLVVATFATLGLAWVQLRRPTVAGR